MKLFHTIINSIFTNDTNDEFYTMTSEGVFEPINEEDVIFTNKIAKYTPKERTFTVAELYSIIDNDCKICAIVTIKDDFTNFLSEDFGFVMQNLRTFGITNVNVVVESATDVSTSGY